MKREIELFVDIVKTALHGVTQAMLATRNRIKIWDILVIGCPIVEKNNPISRIKSTLFLLTWHFRFLQVHNGEHAELSTTKLFRQALFSTFQGQRDGTHVTYR
jgi:hypothetical protein